MPSLKVTCERCNSELEHICNDNFQGAVVKLYTWRPETGFPEELKKDNPYADERVDEPGTPFFCEAFLYPLLGKDDARTLSALINNIVRAAGLDPHALEMQAHKILEAEQKHRDEREAADEAYRKRRDEKKAAKPK